MKKVVVWAIASLSAVGGGLVSSAAEAQCTGADKLHEVHVFGRAQTRFSPTPATTLEALQSQFESYRADLEQVLQVSGWAGDPADLFAAVRDARPGEGAVRAREAAPGEAFQWMAFRKRGKPACVQNIRWAGKKPLPVWEITVESNDAVHTFVVPQVCLNLAWAGSKPVERPQPPTCTLTARQESCEPRRISLAASGDFSSIRITGVTTPSGAGDPSGVTQSGGGWSYAPDRDGAYSFTAEVTNDAGLTATCSARVTVDCPDPVCSLQATWDADSRQIRLASSGSQGQVTLTGFTLPDGSAGDLGALVPAGDGAWTFDVGTTLPRKSGDYTYSFDAETRLSGETDSCEAAVTVPVARKTGWIVRGWGGPIDAKGDKVTSFAARPSDNFINEHSTFKLESGTGFGGDIEYRVNRRLGIDFGVLLGALDAEYMLDIDLEWGMEDKDIELTMPFVGLHFHLTPDSRADVWVGPFVGYVTWDGETFTALGRTIRRDFDDETTIGVAVGVDVPFRPGGAWGLTGAVRYMGLTAEDGPIELEVDPLIATVGIGYSF